MKNYSLCDIEEQRFKDFLKKHQHQTLEDVDSLLTSSYEICFRPSGVGPSITIVCDCGEKEDITHHEHW